MAPSASNTGPVPTTDPETRLGASDRLPPPTPPSISRDDRVDPTTRAWLGTGSIVLGVAGILPLLPIIGSVAAVVCRLLALHEPSPVERQRGRVGIALGALGLLMPAVALFVYCVVLGYPFPLHRYRPG